MAACVLGSYLSFKAVSDRQRSMNWSHIYDTSMAPHMAISALSEFIFKSGLILKSHRKASTQIGEIQIYNGAAVCDLLAMTLLALGKPFMNCCFFIRLI
ncbi:hypothetical protein PO124_15740 [Bacillus licheniformis]|nr:hypothetical protein [Bacillus licheniformis]